MVLRHEASARRSWLAGLVLSALAACFLDLSGAPCGKNGDCPPGQRCATGGRCAPGGGPADSGAADAGGADAGGADAGGADAGAEDAGAEDAGADDGGAADGGGDGSDGGADDAGAGSQDGGSSTVDGGDPGGLDGGAAAELCANGGDDDGDGLVDCADPGCLAECWTVTTNLHAPRYHHTATLLIGGGVLVAGGISVGSTYPDTSETFDPASATWTERGPNSLLPRTDHTATLLQNGKVLLVGGSSYAALRSAMLYDPATGSWTATGGLLNPRSLHTATRLANGEVLIAGGLGDGATYLTSIELYDPDTGTFRLAGGGLWTARSGHTATLLESGRVLFAGGQSTGGILVTDAETCLPGVAWGQDAGPMGHPRVNHTATPLDLLNPTRVLFVGGIGGLSSAEKLVWSGGDYLWGDVESLSPGRGFHTATLQNGLVVVTGGAAGGNVFNEVRAFDPVNNRWSQHPPLTTRRQEHTATLLQNGHLLVVGGLNGAVLSSCEIR